MLSRSRQWPPPRPLPTTTTSMLVHHLCLSHSVTLTHSAMWLVIVGIPMQILLHWTSSSSNASP
eukprot:1224847-Rhodomonas_salina.2